MLEEGGAGGSVGGSGAYEEENSKEPLATDPMSPASSIVSTETTGSVHGSKASLTKSESCLCDL